MQCTQLLLFKASEMKSLVLRLRAQRSITRSHFRSVASDSSRWLSGRHSATSDAAARISQRHFHTGSDAPIAPRPSAQQHSAHLANPSASSGTLENAAGPLPTTPDAAPRLLFLPSPDSFAQSRVKNYVQRILARPAPASTSTTVSSDTGANVVDVVPRPLSRDEMNLFGTSAALEKAWISSFQLPVDVFVHDRLTRRHITVAGVAQESKTSIIAACMHAELCLDALRIPLFTLERRQHQRVLQAQAEGRTSAEISDVPRELSQVTLPPPVCIPLGAVPRPPQRLPSYQPVRAAQSTGDGSAGGLRGGDGRAESTTHKNLPRRQQQQQNARGRTVKQPRKRYDTFVTRYGADPFMQSTVSELAALQSSLFAHNRLSEGDDDDRGGGDGSGNRHREDLDALSITPDDIAILQPELLTCEPHETSAPHRGGNSPNIPDRNAHAGVAPNVMLQPHLVKRKNRSIVKVDETEGGAYDLVEGEPGEWVVEPEVPGAWCVRDPGAVARVSQYLTRVTGHSFHDSVQVHFSDEETHQFLERKGRFGVEMKRWYTAVIDLKEIGVRATGKGTTQQAAHDLCAMHAESLLQWFGVPVFTSTHAQALYFDACLRWGRRIAATPIDPTTVNLQTANLPKPMKEWFRNTKSRARGSEMNVMEKLLLLNRKVVHAYRKHIVEVDFFATDRYSELLSLAEECVRSFMVAMNHPFEAAFFTLVYQKDSQYRTSIYLPLPERYGARGGYAIACTPVNSTKLCALSAVDVLCSLDVIPQMCLVQPRWQRMLAVRESLGLFLPQSFLYNRHVERAVTDAARAALRPPPPPPHCMLRSPPGYREAVGLNVRIPPHEEVWRVMLMDVGVFDVVPNFSSLRESSHDPVEGDCCFFPEFFFLEAASHLFGWRVETLDCYHHMFQYTGAQRYLNMVKPVANTFWLELPLERAVYGKRTAVGRCQQRNGALRMTFVHALRILRTLKLAPWDSWEENKLSKELYKNEFSQTRKRLRQWRWLCTHVLDGHAEGDSTLSSTPEAQITNEVVARTITKGNAAVSTRDSAEAVSMVDVLSPHPVISRSAAIAAMC